MADLNVQLVLRLVDRATGPARAAMRAIERLGGEGLVREAQRVNRGAHLMAGGLGTVTGAAIRGGLVMAGYAGTIAGLSALLVRPAARFEQLRVQLTNLEGSAEGADKALGWIEEFATRTPLQLEDTVAAYARLKAFGLDPTQGALQALTDTMAASGGGVEQLDGLVLALGQSWTKGKLQGEEVLQMLERGVPVWDLLGRKLGKTAAELQEMASKGQLGRKEITLLVEAMAERNKGASEAMSKTWDGSISNVLDHWGRFQRMIMGSGVFDYLKTRLRGFLDLLDRMAADGRLQEYADQAARVIMSTLNALWAFGGQVVALWNRLAPVIARVAELLGGWDRLAWFAAAVLMGRLVFGLVSGFLLFAKGLFLVGSGLIGMAWHLVRAAVMANPLLAVIAAIAGAAWVIYQNWDGIVAYFQDKIGRVRAAFDQGLLNGVLKLLSEFNPFRLMRDAAEGLFRYLTGWSFADVTRALVEAFTSIDFIRIGIDMMNALWQGMKSIVGQIGAWFKAQATSWIPEMPAWLGGSPAASDPAPVPGRALGGPVRAGQIYRWQEEGRELFVPRSDGDVISNRQLRAMQALNEARAGIRILPAAPRPGSSQGRRAGRLDIGGITINAAPGMDPRAVARAVRREIEALGRERGFALHDGGNYA